MTQSLSPEPYQQFKFSFPFNVTKCFSQKRKKEKGGEIERERGRECQEHGRMQFPHHAGEQHKCISAIYGYQ